MPPEFWDHPDIRTALGQWHMGRVIAAYRNHPYHGRPLRQEAVGAWVGVTQPQLSRIENGPAVSDLGKLIQWARLLDIPPGLLWFQVPRQRTLPSPHPAPAPPPPPVPVAVDAIPSMRGAGGDAAVMQAWRAVDAQIGGAHLYATVMAYLHADMAPRLFGGGRDSDGPAVFTAAAALTEMAGWMAHDAGHDDQARRHFGRARDLSSVGNDRHLGVHVLASLAHLAHHQAQPDEAIGWAREGQRALASAPRQPELAARVLAMQARGHATLGHPRETLTLLHRAEEALQGNHDVEPSAWVSPFDAGSLASEAARCMRQLGDLPAAQHHAQRILELRPAAGHARSRAFGHLLLAAIMIERGELEQGCGIAADVLHSTQSLGSHLVIQQLRDLRALLQPHRASAPARNFLDSSAEALLQRLWLYQWLTADTQPRTGPTTP